MIVKTASAACASRALLGLHNTLLPDIPEIALHKAGRHGAPGRNRAGVSQCFLDRCSLRHVPPTATGVVRCVFVKWVGTFTSQNPKTTIPYNFIWPGMNIQKDVEQQRFPWENHLQMVGECLYFRRVMSINFPVLVHHGSPFIYICQFGRLILFSEPRWA